MNHEQVPIWEQYTMTIEEASRYFRIGEGKLRKFVECKLCLNGMPVPLLRNCYSIFNGTKYR